MGNLLALATFGSSKSNAQNVGRDTSRRVRAQCVCNEWGEVGHLNLLLAKSMIKSKSLHLLADTLVAGQVVSMNMSHCRELKGV